MIVSITLSRDLSVIRTPVDYFFSGHVDLLSTGTPPVGWKLRGSYLSDLGAAHLGQRGAITHYAAIKPTTRLCAAC